MVRFKAVFKSWNNHRARIYRELHQIPHDLGTAVNVQSMVLGIVIRPVEQVFASTRNPANGEPELLVNFYLMLKGKTS